MPLSTTQIVSACDAVVTLHAAGAWIAPRCHSIGKPGSIAALVQRAESPDVESHVAESQLVESHDVESHVAESHVAESHCAASHVAESQLVESHWAPSRDV